MPKTVWKYEITMIEPVKKFFWPVGSKIVHVDSQQEGVITLWVEHEHNGDEEERIFWVHGTGHGIVDNHEYVGTSIQDPFVWHVYEEK